jgi:hypothetical protein
VQAIPPKRYLFEFLASWTIIINNIIGKKMKIKTLPLLYWPYLKGRRVAAQPAGLSPAINLNLNPTLNPGPEPAPGRRTTGPNYKVVGRPLCPAPTDGHWTASKANLQLECQCIESESGDWRSESVDALGTTPAISLELSDSMPALGIMAICAVCRRRRHYAATAAGGRAAGRGQHRHRRRRRRRSCLARNLVQH